MSVRAGALVIAFAAAGCDLIFPPGAGPVAGDADAPVSSDGPVIGDAFVGDAFQLPDAGVDGNAATDSDGDGVNDALDNCPGIQNPLQYNKDGDTTGDVCDPCPHLHGATGADIDSDGDGLGDLCDPLAVSPGDNKTFIGFYNGGAIFGWSQSPMAQWSSGGGELVMPFETTPDATLTTDLMLGNGIITIGARVTEVAAGNVDHYVAVQVSGPGPDFYRCAAAAPTGASSELRYAASVNSTDESASEPWPGGVLLGQTITLTVRMRFANMDCFVRTEPGGNPLAGLSVSVGPHLGAVTLQGYFVGVEIDYLYVAGAAF